jgi:enoyl-CoA hydratase
VLSLERDGNVATLWLDNPDRRNAMGPALWADLPVAMAELSDDPEVRAVVVAARGPHFTVGLDLKTMGGAATGSGSGSGSASAPSSEATRRLALYRNVKRLQQSITSVAECPKPVIAAVHGYCIGGGVDLITACDIRLASADAKFSVRETKIAITADVGTLQRLPNVISAGHVAELVYTGKDITADRAREIGLVNDVHADHDAVVKAATEMAEEIAANSPLAVQGSKAVLQAGGDFSVAQGLDYVALWNSAFLGSNDLTEAMTAFVEKRPPKFTGS